MFENPKSHIVLISDVEGQEIQASEGVFVTYEGHSQIEGFTKLTIRTLFVLRILPADVNPVCLVVGTGVLWIDQIQTTVISKPSDDTDLNIQLLVQPGSGIIVNGDTAVWCEQTP